MKTYIRRSIVFILASMVLLAGGCDNEDANNIIELSEQMLNGSEPEYGNDVIEWIGKSYDSVIAQKGFEEGPAKTAYDDMHNCVVADDKSEVNLVTLRSAKYNVYGITCGLNKNVIEKSLPNDYMLYVNYSESELCALSESKKIFIGFRIDINDDTIEDIIVNYGQELIEQTKEELNSAVSEDETDDYYNYGDVDNYAGDAGSYSNHASGINNNGNYVSGTGSYGNRVSGINGNGSYSNGTYNHSNYSNSYSIYDYDDDDDEDDDDDDYDDEDDYYDEDEDDYDDEYVIPYSSDRKLKKKDLKGLSAKELRIARNEIYARNGRRFVDQELQEYFDSMDWYYGDVEPDDFVESEMLNKVERYNTKFIREYEESMK